MAASGPGNPGLDQSTAGLRRLMMEAAQDDGARLLALSAIAQRRVLVATWPHSPESVRTLTNSDGEQAMPLFSGFDVLLDAAHRFGWTNPDGTISHRELNATEALRGAITHNVHFVVLDICTDCTIEFGREEIERVLQTAAASAEPARERATAATRQTRKRPELEALVNEERSSGLGAAIVEEAPRVRAARPDPRAEPMQATPLAAVAVTRVPQAQVEAARQQAIAARAEALAAEAQAHAEAQAAAAFAHQNTQPVPPMNAEPAAQTLEEFALDEAESPQQPVEHEFAAALPDLDMALVPPLAAPPRRSASHALHNQATLPDLNEPALPNELGLDLLPSFSADEPQANPAALTAAAMVTQVGKMSKDAATQQAAGEVANMLKDMAMKGSVDDSLQGQAKSAAKMLAGMLSADPNAKKKKKRGEKKSSAEVQAVQAPAADAGAEATPAAGEEGQARGLRPLEVSFDDGLLSQIADALRKHPEVEWACEVSDGSDVPVVAVRVDPGFMTHVALIKSAIVRAGEAHRAPLSVLLLDDPQQMREARAQGNLFFPWRKRAAKR